MDYLVIEGFKDAAQNFARESGLTPSIDLDSIEYRMGIKNAIQRGDVEEAITKVNDLNPEVSYKLFLLLLSFILYGYDSNTCTTPSEVCLRDNFSQRGKHRQQPNRPNELKCFSHAFCFL